MLFTTKTIVAAFAAFAFAAPSMALAFPQDNGSGSEDGGSSGNSDCCGNGNIFACCNSAAGSLIGANCVAVSGRMLLRLVYHRKWH